MIDFSPTPEQEQLRRITSQLMERYVYPVYRAARAARIYDGPDEVHRMVVARRILREYR